jgi:hypothetical protein
VVPIVALAAAGAVLVSHGEPLPVQRGSGVSVQVVKSSPAPNAPIPSFLVAKGGRLDRVSGAGWQQVSLPGGRTPIEVRQVSATVTAVLAVGLGGAQAYLVHSDSAVVTPLGTAQRIVAGAAPAAVAIERDGVALRFTADGTPVGDPVPLPDGMNLAADSVAGLLASTQVDVIDLGEPVDSQTATEAGGAAGSAEPTSSIYLDGTWVSLGRQVAVAAVENVALVWITALRTFAAIDLTSPAAFEPIPGSYLTPATRLLPAVPGVVMAGPLTVSPDGAFFAVAGQVGARPRLVVGSLSATVNDTFDVVSLGGDLLAGIAQPAPVWIGVTTFQTRPDGVVVSYEPNARKATQLSLPANAATVPGVATLVTGLGPG